MAALGASIAHLLDAYGLLAVFLVMLLKELGVPIPVPGDFVMLAAAAQAAAGKVAAWQAFGALVLAMVLGAWGQYHFARGLGRPLLYRYGRYVGLTAARLDRAVAAVRRGGVPGLVVAIVTPGLRTAMVPACGLARLPYRAFFPGVIAGSAIFVALHFALGYAGAPLVAALTGALGLPLLALVGALLVLGLIGWLALRRARRGRASAGEATLEGLRDWTDACCPACLVLGAVGLARQPEA
jgi:membrane protein DedA with SNARE-associated domain